MAKLWGHHPVSHLLHTAKRTGAVSRHQLYLPRAMLIARLCNRCVFQLEACKAPVLPACNALALRMTPGCSNSDAEHIVYACAFVAFELSWIYTSKNRTCVPCYTEQQLK